MTRIVGIDLGTTNSLIAYMDRNVPTVVPGRNGRTMVPSVVAMTDNGLIVGDAAKDHLVRNPERTIYSVKRFMGKSLADIQNEVAYFPYTLEEQGGVIRIRIGDKSYSPPSDLRHDSQRTQAAGGSPSGRKYYEGCHNSAGLFQR